MGIGLVVIKKRLGGEEWVNTHCFQTDAAGTVGLTEADIVTIGGDVPITEASTNSAGTGEPLLHAIVGYERRMCISQVEFIEAYVTDGRQKAGQTGTTYMSQGFLLPGLVALGDPLTSVPGSITVMMTRNAMGFSRRPGRLFLRGVVDETAVRFYGLGGVDWQATSARDNINTRHNSALTASGLSAYFGSTPVGGPWYAIPRYHYNKDNPADPLNGQIYASTICAGLTLDGLVSRQMKRGRKER